MKPYQQTKRALGSAALLTLVADTDKTAEAIFTGLWQIIDGFEQRFSRFLPDSELSLVNRNAGSKVQVSPEFHRVLQDARELSIITGGLFNPLLLPALQQAGYAGSWPNPGEVDERINYQTRRVANITELTIGDDWVRLPEQTALDLGGCGKGMVLDQLADYCAGKVQGFWFSLGGDIIAAGLDASGQPWELGIEKAQNASQPTGLVTSDGSRIAVATSGIIARAGVKNGKLWHHLIDPRTLMPAETDVLTATVVSPQAVLADVYASCAVILGAGKAIPFLKDQNIRQAMLQTDSGNVIKLGEFA